MTSTRIMRGKLLPAFMITLFLLIFPGCETIIKVDLPEHDPLLVINAVIQPGSFWNVNVTRSIGILETGPPANVPDATVEIWQDNQLLVNLAYAGDGDYRSSANLPQAGIDYTLRVSAPGFDAIRADTRIPMVTPIDSAITSGSISTGTGDIDLAIYFTDRANEDNFYSLRIIDSNLPGPPGSEYLFFTSKEPALQGSNQFFGIDEENTFEGIEALFDDVLLDGKHNRLDITYFDWSQFGQSAEVQLLTITEAQYRYALAADLQTETDDNPFAEPVLIFSNIDNGLGIFTGFSISQRRLR